ncbi:4Fe-4S ferredoxin iron-sulfur binding domain protein [Methanosalsum zhilinae DSM 4017]|uniref:4Fe-4S ferredoxin iron-sulfur binding domain protein n=1 Tax=Methanosalsum zhilinae (strain DSM 4017 / NBRC 107636 / OCM 62 / WeN5) TaxID=679901 RepID=F7XQG1_METZD|nr:4Fe-4S binding protein [Methanosalsum zhilinae]AEH60462.1 4Fe-4S ferredoxin iron-sulfur binding domain protein [Methanosalsum zhilinae DSM 4017]
MKIYIDKDRCTGCGACRRACPKGPRIYSIEEVEGKKIAVVKDPSYCLGCKMCTTVCKPDAITLEN